MLFRSGSVTLTLFLCLSRAASYQRNAPLTSLLMNGYGICYFCGMKHVTATLLFALSLTCQAQEQPPFIPSVVPPMDPVNLRLSIAADELELSADRSDLGLYALLIGGAMTAVAAGGRERDGWVVGGITVLTSYTLFLNGNGHKRRAARELRHQ